jgi:hypothetical protein
VDSGALEVAEDEEPGRERVEFEPLLDQNRQAVDGFAQIDDLPAQGDRHVVARPHHSPASVSNISRPSVPAASNTTPFGSRTRQALAPVPRTAG